MGRIMKQEKEELTGLYTADTAKMMIEEYLEKEQENVGMIVLDLDGFEQVNTMFDREKGDELLLDLCYEEASSAQVDLNCVMTGAGGLVELQGTGEGRPFTIVEQRALVELCAKGIRELQNIQRQVLGG